jgi:hypothetical protein
MEGFHEIGRGFLKCQSFSKFAMWGFYTTGYHKKSLNKGC